jgi:membrane protease YdiL (CAAX protease family)
VQNEELNKNEYTAPSLKEETEISQALLNATPDNPPWNSGVAFSVWLLSVFFIFIVPTVFVGVYLVAAGVDFYNREQLQDVIKNDITSSLVSLAAVIPAHILTLAVVWAVVTRFNTFSFRQTLGWSFNQFRIWHIFVITALILILAAALTTYFGEQENEFMRILKNSRTAVYLVAFLATFTAPLVEEVVYRGVLYSAFQRTFGVPLAVVLVTGLFALVHVPQYLPDFVSISMICLVSLILTLIRAKTGNLLPCIALHFVFNGVQALFLIFQPFLERYIENQPQQAAFIVQFLK